MHNGQSKIMNKIGKWAVAIVLGLGLAVGCGFGIANSLSPKSIAEEETITLPDGSPIPTKPEYPTTYWEDQPGVKNYVWQGSGTKDDPYLIDSREAFAWFIYCCCYKTSASSSSSPYLDGMHFKLTTDLDMSGHRGYSRYISSYSGLKDCEFDGGGHTISNIYGAGGIGIFNKLYNNTSIHDLTIKNSSFSLSTTSNSYTYAGAICQNSSSNAMFYNINIEGCYVGGTYTTKQQVFVSPLFAYGSAKLVDNVVVKDCFIGGGMYAYGIAYNVNSFKNCYSLNNYICTSYTASQYYYPCAAGIGATTGSEDVGFYNCHNSSTIVSTSLAAGIGNSNLNFYYCSNSGNIKVVRDSTSLIKKVLASGIGTDVNNSNYAYYCWNTGNIEIDSVISGTACGVCLLGNQNCFNTGEIKALNLGKASAFGMLVRKDQFNLYNTGYIHGNSYTGGIFTENNDAGGGWGYNLINASVVESSFIRYGAICAITSSNIINSYWDNTKTEQSGTTSSGAQPIANLEAFLRDENEMRGNGSLTWRANYPWDFDNVWAIDPEINDGLPYIRIPEYTTPILLNGADITSAFETKEAFQIRANEKYENVEIFLKVGEEGEFASIGNNKPFLDDGIYYVYANYTENGEGKTSEVYRLVKDGSAPNVTISGDCLDRTGSDSNRAAVQKLVVDVTDSVSSSWTLYYKGPKNTAYVAAEGHHMEISGEENYGTWNFYATDSVSNRSTTVSIHLISDTWISDPSLVEEPAGSGTKTDPYIVSTAGQLAWFAEKSFGKSELATYIYIELANDIDLSAHRWFPIGWTQGFDGSLDGKGHVIRGMTTSALLSYQALFAHVGKEDLIGRVFNVSNLGFEDGKIEGKDYASSVVAWSRTKTIIKNCYNKCEIISSSKCGGIMGYCSSNYETTIEDCFNEGNIIAGHIVGGIIQNTAGANLSISNCYNAGNITSAANSNGRIGGIIGNPGYNRTTYIRNCYNVGNLQAGEVGGLISSVGYSGYSATVQIENSYSIGNITSTASYAYLGGLIGRFYQGKATLTNSFAEGNITHTGTSDIYIGGLMPISSTFQNLTLKNCHYRGTITTASISTRVYLAGLIASSVVPKTDLVFENCWVQAEIEAPNVTKANATNIKPFMTYNTGIRNCVYDVKITTKEGVLTEEDGVISKGYYDDGDDTIATDFVGEEWFYCEKLMNGMPVLRSEYWVAVGIEKQIDILPYLQNNGWSKITA